MRTEDTVASIAKVREDDSGDAEEENPEYTDEYFAEEADPEEVNEESSGESEPEE